MKKMILMILILSLLLSGCSGAVPVDTRVQVSLLTQAGCAVEENGLWLEPGDDAVFRLRMDEGYTLASTDYAGRYTTELKDGLLVLTLKDIARPTRVELTLTQEFSTITYDPNGGEGETLVKTYDRTEHLRPNTENGQKLFRRDGHTLVCWNTEPDGSGVRIGLGSRVTVEDSLTLYAQWAPWTEASAFSYTMSPYGTLTITKYQGDHETLVIPARIDGRPVGTINAQVFQNCAARTVILPDTLERLAPDAFQGSAVETVVLFDNVRMISDDSFSGCENLRTIYINAAEDPFGYAFRKESVYADKVDLLIMAQGQKKMVFYGGCSTWYNLDGEMAQEAFGAEYQIINLGLNGTVNAEVQMQILSPYLEAGDVLIHTLELTSKRQLLMERIMTEGDDKLWCGLEYNYDLFSLVDLRTVKGALNSLQRYLDQKKPGGTYQDVYRDQDGLAYLDAFGCIPFLRTQTRENLADMVRLEESYVNQEAMESLDRYYTAWSDRGITVYASYACVNMDAVPEAQKNNVQMMNALVKDAFSQMTGAVLISELEDFLFENGDCFDTNYHLLTAPARENTAAWIRDLKAAMMVDGLWEVGE